MATVPVYQRQQTPRPTNRQDVSVSASPNDFGAQIGQGMQQVARGIDNVGDAVSQVQQLRDESTFRQTRNGTMQDLWEITNEYRGLNGQNAISQREEYQKRVDAALSKRAEGLNTRTGRMFAEASSTLKNDALRTIITHEGGEIKAQRIADADASTDAFLNQALINVGDQARFDKYIGAGLAEIRSLAADQGWTPLVQDQKEREYLSGATKKQVIALANQGSNGVLAAKAIRDKYADRLTGADRIALDDALNGPVATARGQQYAASILSGAPVERYDATPERAGAAAGAGGAAVERRALPPIGGNIGNVLSQLKGLNEKTDAAAISSFIKNSAGINIDPRTTAWCAAFVNGVLATQGIEGTGKLNARSFLNFGMATDNPQPGDVVVFKRGNSDWQGHVGFFNGFDADGNIRVIGGNQSNSVKESTYSAADLLGFRTAGKVDANTASMPNYSPQGLGFIHEQLNKISNPEERAAAAKYIDAQLTQRKKLMDAQQEQVQTWAEQQIISNPTMDVTKIPLEVQQTLGAKGMTTLLSYQEKVRTAGQPTTDDRVLYELQTQYANNPLAFGKVDLFQYRDKLSNADWDKVSGWRQAAMSDQRKAVEDGTVYKQVFEQSTQALRGAGLVTTGETDAALRAATERKIGQFQQEIMLRVEDFQKQNSGRVPTFDERQKMISDSLLKMIVSTERSAWDPLKTPWSSTSSKEIFAFEGAYQEPGVRIIPDISYDDIPTDFRARIGSELKAKNGRTATPDEIREEYGRFVTGQ